jgi:hypothetical protein
MEDKRIYLIGCILTGLFSNTKITKEVVDAKFKPQDTLAWHTETAIKYADVILEKLRDE